MLILPPKRGLILPARRRFIVGAAACALAAALPSPAEAITPLGSTTFNFLNTGTSSPVDTTGAKLLVWTFAGNFFNSSTPSDSPGNTYIHFDTSDGAGHLQWHLWYCINPITSASHTFTQTGSSASTGNVVSWWNGTFVADHAVVSNFSLTGSTTTIQPGSITASQAGCIFFTGASFSNTSGGTQTNIDSGFSLINQVPGVAATSFPNAQSFFLQGSAAALNPTITFSATAATVAACMINFKFTAPASPFSPTLSVTGIGP